MKKLDILTLENHETILKKMRQHLPFIIKTGIDLTENFNQFLTKINHESINILKDSSITGTRKNALMKTVSIFEYFNDNYIKTGWYLSENILKNNTFRKWESEILESNHKLESLIKIRRALAINLWLSPANKFSGLHYDNADNFNLQISGQKTFIIAPPQIKDFYPGKIIQQKYHVSNIKNIFDYDTNQFPRFKNKISKFYEINLKSGDMIYIPSFWWHQVHTENHALSMNINWWYANHSAMLQHPKKTFGGFCVFAYRSIFEKHLL